MPSTNDNRSVLTSIYNTMQTTIDNLATKFRNKTDDLLETMLDISIEGLCDNNLKNRRYMERLMRLNILEKDTTMNLLGNDAMPYGNSRMLDTNSVHPSYVRDIDYVKNFMEYRHEDYTRKTDLNPSSFNDYGNGNELYTRTQNLVPDELNRLEGRYSNHTWYSNDRWQRRNRDSILAKTKTLFNANKINTIISGFCTSHGEGGITDDTDAKSQYGMSHGRNLLLKEAESDGGTGFYNVNGYNNPYCRVWTHHYQYDRLDKLIRPFVTVDGGRGDNNIGKVVTKSKFHNWTNFSKGKNAYWKKDNSGWKYSVLNDNGFVNIAPKYDSEQDKKIHAKQCMFSIENLAWKGYDPYSFEKALSWEQRGPMGGRIMWFPPYGITFNETTQANWTNHTFIGRGEDVYTYTNTVRSGNLSFLMVVDHPSIIDYVSWHGGKGNGKEDTVNDSDLLRFFAGCDSETIINAAKPTPLTDEALQTFNVIEYTKATPAPLPQPTIEPEIPEDIKEITFYVFYPNNYSGVYDMENSDSNVNAIAYLLCGSNAQKDAADNYEDVPLAFTYKSMNNFNGVGYEMSDNGVTNDSDSRTGPIIGTRMAWRTALNKGIKNYPSSSSKIWQYRIDGEYKVPSRGNIDKNTYDQTLLARDNYKDSRSYKLNNDAEEVKKIFNETSNEYVYSLAEVAAAIADENIKNYLITNKGVSEERVNQLKDIFKNYQITNINGIGYSNSHGNNSSKSVNNKRNDLLAIQRIRTVVQWFNKYSGLDLSGTEEIVKPDASISVKNQNVSREVSKQWRSARMSLVLKNSEKKKQAETSQTTTDENGNVVSNGTHNYIGYTSKTDANNIQYYQNNKDGSCWVEVTDEKNPHYGELTKVSLADNKVSNGNYFIRGGIRANAKITVDRNGNVTSVSSSGDVNDVRYDQEYYFFKALKQSDPIIFDKLMTKIQYFDPAFHSMTPEGFSARLTFLQQCARQGNTIGTSDTTNTMTPTNTASNLAFGRPPFCVLRLGDFYNQMIAIDNISINYEPLMWDLNTEGVGVIPLLANVTISFKFIGGGDMTGPVRRLQNAMTFNYYANTRLYDNRADRMKYKNGDEYSLEQGAKDNDIDVGASEFYIAEQRKGDNIYKQN